MPEHTYKIVQIVGSSSMGIQDAVDNALARAAQTLRHLDWFTVKEIRGAGLMWGLELDRPAAPVVEAALQLGLLINRTADTVVRLLPPYVITVDEIDEGVSLLGRALATVEEAAR